MSLSVRPTFGFGNAVVFGGRMLVVKIPFGNITALIGSMPTSSASLDMSRGLAKYCFGCCPGPPLPNSVKTF